MATRNFSKRINLQHPITPRKLELLPISYETVKSQRGIEKNIRACCIHKGKPKISKPAHPFLKKKQKTLQRLIQFNGPKRTQSISPTQSTELPPIEKVKLAPIEAFIVSDPPDSSSDEELKEEKKLTEEERIELWKRLLEILITRY